MKANGLLVAGMLGALALATVVAQIGREDEDAPPGSADAVSENELAQRKPPDPGRALSDRSVFWEGGGRVETISKGFQYGGLKDGLRIVIRRGADEFSVLAGPEWYLESQDFDINLSDEIQIRGSMITVGGEPVIIPNMIIKDDRVIHLRDEEGTPLWLG